MAKPVAEIVFNRSPVTLNDTARLQDGNDLNDALLDFFTKLGMAIVSKDVNPCVYSLSSLFYGKLSGDGSKSGEEGWENVKSWTRKIKPGLMTYPAIAVPINEVLTDPDDKKKILGQHWWLALVLNPENAARGKTSTVICVDSMKRRITSFDPATKHYKKDSLMSYSIEVTKIEQAAHRLWVYFDCVGDGSHGPLPDPRGSTLAVDKSSVVTNPDLALTVNNNMPGQPGRYEGQLEFALDGRCKASNFDFHYSPGFGFDEIPLQFDAFNLSKVQKNVTRMLGGFLKKEWEKEEHKASFEKKRVRAAMVNAPQQENLYDCGVFVLENVLCILQQGKEYVDKISEDPTSEEALWVGQAEVRHRRKRLVDCLGICFEACARVGTVDLNKVLEEDADLKEKVKACLTDLPEHPAKMAKFV